MIPPNDAALAALCVDTYRATPAGDVVDAAEDRAVITRREGFAVLAARGTANLEGWISDFLAAPRVPRAHPTLGDGEAGFVDGALALWAAVRPRLQRETPLVIAGHSRGAGEAPWLAGLALLDGFDVAYVACFEAPWTAGPVLRDFLLPRVPGRQYVNGNDPVPDVPRLAWLVPNVWPVTRIGQPAAWPISCHAMAAIALEIAALEGAPAPSFNGASGSEALVVR